MITANVIHRVFRIKVGDSEGTAFTIDVRDREYLVTAKHVAAPLKETGELGVFSNGTWSTLRTHVVGHATGDADVSVLALNRRLTPPGLPVEPTHTGLTYGQDVYFLGFPYGFLGKYIFGPDGYPLPFVKRATLSLFDGTVFLLDGHNNPGFSGAPVVFTEPHKHDFRVAAVVSSYQYVDEPIYDRSQATGLTYRYNTGLIVTYAINHALDLIEANPIGYLGAA
jgi:hypothetical protein